MFGDFGGAVEGSIEKGDLMSPFFICEFRSG